MARNYFVSTVVVAPGQLDPMAKDCLEGMAISGGAAQPPNLPPASNQTELATTIGDIVRTVAMDACTLDLEGVRIQETMRVAVTWKDMSIPHDRNSGWDLTGNGFTITLRGTWCDHLIEEGPAELPFPGLRPAPPLTRGPANHSCASDARRKRFF